MLSVGFFLHQMSRIQWAINPIQSFYVSPTGVCNVDLMSHFPSFTVTERCINAEGQRGTCGLCFLPLASPDWDSSRPRSRAATAWRRFPRDPRCILEKRALARNGAHPNWHLRGHGRLARSQVPAAALGACTLGRASIIYCLLFINNPPTSSSSSSTPRTHTRVPPSLPSAAHLHFYFSYTIFYYVDISHRLWCFFTPAVRNVSFSAERHSMLKCCLSHLSLLA